MSRVTIGYLFSFAIALGAGITMAQAAPPDNTDQASLRFARVATLPVHRNQPDPGATTVAEIVGAGEQGKVLVYTDGVNGELGFVDLSIPARPQPAGTVSIGGEPTSVAISGGHVLAVTDTSASHTDPSGDLVVLDIESRKILARHALGGQPDSIAVSPDGRYALIAIENERNEDHNDGRLPQKPAGYAVIVDLQGAPEQWSLRRVELTGIAERFGNDPEPEFVDINTSNIAAVTLQENNHIVLIDLASGDVVGDFSAGTADLAQIDARTDGVIAADDALTNVYREPDGIAWIGTDMVATADEGDLDGGSRGFTLFAADGAVRYTAGNALEQTAIRLGHFPEGRAGSKGIEPENVEYARYGDHGLLFVGAERASLVYVYRVDAGGQPHFLQALPSGVEPEGLLALPQRGLFVAASEEDKPGDGIRSTLTIYALADGAAYPDVVSAEGPNGTAIPWGALSALAVDADQPDVAYTIHDSALGHTRLYRMSLRGGQATIVDATVLSDANGALAAVAPQLVNGDGSVSLDAEGLDLDGAGGFWIASEGKGSVDKPERPVKSPNLLLHVSADGVIGTVVSLPDSVDNRQRRHGFEGLAVVNSTSGQHVYVAFQREWAGDPARHARIGRYDVASQTWAFAYYPLEPPASTAGGWAGLSDLANLADGSLAIIERDNQAGALAAIKRLYRFSPADTEFQPAGANAALATVDKTLVRDVLPALRATGGQVLEKLEGLAVAGGDALVLTDNDGVDDSNGETQLLRLPAVFSPQ